MNRRAHVTVMFHITEDELSTFGIDPKLHYLARFYTLARMTTTEIALIPRNSTRFPSLYQRMTDATRAYQRESRRSMERLRDMRI